MPHPYLYRCIIWTALICTPLHCLVPHSVTTSPSYQRVLLLEYLHVFLRGEELHAGSCKQKGEEQRSAVQGYNCIEDLSHWLAKVSQDSRVEGDDDFYTETGFLIFSFYDCSGALIEETPDASVWHCWKGEYGSQ